MMQIVMIGIVTHTISMLAKQVILVKAVLQKNVQQDV